MKLGSLIILLYCFSFLVFYNVKITKSSDHKYLTINIYDQMAKAYGKTQDIATIVVKSKNKIY